MFEHCGNAMGAVIISEIDFSCPEGQIVDAVPIGYHPDTTTDGVGMCFCLPLIKGFTQYNCIVDVLFMCAHAGCFILVHSCVLTFT